MAEELLISLGENKEEKYQTLIPQIEALIHGEENIIANMANITAALQQQFHWLWVGFYNVYKSELVLGPFQGPIACTRIPKGKGVCGTAWAQKKTLVIPNVDDFPGHIACSSASKSEIVVPLMKNNEVLAVLDVDSTEFHTFDQVDARYLEDLMQILSANIYI